MVAVTMPQLGETVAEGTVTTWFKAVGDTVAVGEVLFEVSTDKVDTEVPSTAAGVLREILVAEGETVPVGAALAVVGDDTAADAAVSAAPPGPPAGVPGPAQDPAQARAQTAAAAPAPEAEPAAAPAAAPTAAPTAAPAAGSAAAPQTPAPPVVPASAGGAGYQSPSQPGTQAVVPNSRHRASPLVRRLLRERGLSPTT